MTDTYKFPRLEHPLKNAKKLTEEALSRIEDSSVAEYEKQYDSWAVIQREDVKLASTNFRTALDLVEKIFGKNSKEFKYLDRKQSMGESLIDSNAKLYCNPDTVSQMVRDAKKKQNAKAKASIGVGDNDLEKINIAIKYLSEKGKVFGTDFTAFNAVDLANMTVVERVALGAEKVDVVTVAETVNECTSCVEEHGQGVFKFGSSLAEGECSCSCGYRDYNVSLTLGSDGIEAKVGAER